MQSAAIRCNQTQHAVRVEMHRAREAACREEAAEDQHALEAKELEGSVVARAVHVAAPRAFDCLVPQLADVDERDARMQPRRLHHRADGRVAQDENRAAVIAGRDADGSLDIRPRAHVHVYDGQRVIVRIRRGERGGGRGGGRGRRPCALSFASPSSDGVGDALPRPDLVDAGRLDPREESRPVVPEAHSALADRHPVQRVACHE